MEKQLIDDLFARKLREAELPPSPDAFSRLQSRMASTPLPTSQRRVAVWWYGAAAASLLLITLFVFRNNLLPKQPESTPLAAQTQTAKVAETNHTEPPIPLAKTVRGGTDQVGQQQVAEGKSGADEPNALLTGTKIEVVTAKNVAQSSLPSIPTPVPEAVVAITLTPVLVAPKTEAIATTVSPTKPIQDAPQAAPLATTSIAQQRVVVLTIEEPQAAAPVVALQPARVESTSQAQSGSLADLVAKVKQLKNGDALARVTPAKRPPDSRSRFGRVFEGVKESLKNETTLE